MQDDLAEGKVSRNHEEMPVLFLKKNGYQCCNLRLFLSASLLCYVYSPYRKSAHRKAADLYEGKKFTKKKKNFIFIHYLQRF